ncbi:MAG: hypothetical protein ABEH89_00495 [bacterium]
MLVTVTPDPVLGDVNFGHTESINETVEQLDETIRERNQSSDTSGSSGCMVSYPDWLDDVDTRADLREELLEPDTTPSATRLDVKNNPDFDESKDLTADTIIRRCNEHFRDKGDTEIQHWVYCRAMRLPSGDTFSNMTELYNYSDSAPADLYTAAFFHGSNVDDPSENWLVPVINQYQEECRSRPLNIIWIGVWVRDLSVSPPDYKLTLGNKWHVTASDWENTILFDLMEPSQLNFSGHSTASCPFDSTDTHGLWVGGTAETEGRRINDKFTDDQSLWVGKNSSNSGACYSGVASGNPVNANPGRGVQFEYQVTVPDTSTKWVDPVDIADYVLDEF